MTVHPLETHTVEVMDMGRSAYRSGTHREWNRRPHPLHCALPTWLLPPLEVIEHNVKKKINGF